MLNTPFVVLGFLPIRGLGCVANERDAVRPSLQSRTYAIGVSYTILERKFKNWLYFNGNLIQSLNLSPNVVYPYRTYKIFRTDDTGTTWSITRTRYASYLLWTKVCLHAIP